MILVLLFSALTTTGCSDGLDQAAAQDSATIRVATYNIEDVRTADVLDPDHPRLKAAAALIQRTRPDILFVGEMTYDLPGAPDVQVGEAEGQNGQRFADNFLAASQAPGLEPIRYRAFAAPTNTGLASGYDLNRSGEAVTTYPEPSPGSNGTAGPQTDGGRAYGNDSWGFGTFPGQYGMTLLVREGLEVLEDSVRTFRLLPWQAMPKALLPTDPETGAPWYAGKAGEQFRLSSKSHWDVPVRLPNGVVLHVLASHPTPPAFDGKEGRNKRRNHDEIRFWADYLDGAAYIQDDSSRAGGLAPDVPFVIVGDLNADPDEGSSFENPIGTFLLDHPRINGQFVPTADSAGQRAYPNLDPDDTAQWGLRVDYVLPSADVRVLNGEVVRPAPSDTAGVEPSDHFLVWLDLAMPSAER
ncbi:MAG: endonuclease/exonuclease/phosphatase family protein [Rhodothermales bacterium]